ncbi:hypothetical protein Fcan01_15369 [Folsomia candida]|uniref:Uncharacterized protein n=1 Tax=Folsomia candida TaxID=158441 RepID=A0A226DZE0_FOLCA|nr:hypothetical protein Fcan01_15369 [Folsomia candida]
MPTRLGYKAVSLHFSGNSYLPQMPVDFDVCTNETIQLHENHHDEHFQVVKPNPDVQITNIFLGVMMNTAGTMVVGTVIEILGSGKEAVEKVNWLIQRYDTFKEEFNYMDGPSPQPIWKKTSGEIDTFGIAAYAMLSPLPFVPFFAAIFGLAKRHWRNWCINECQVVCNNGFKSVGILEICRHTSEYPLLHLRSTYMDYTQMKIIEALFLGSEATIALELIECGIWLCAASIFATIRLYPVLPFGFYVMFPFFTFAIFGISQLLLPVIAGMHENSAKALAKWVRQVEGNEFPNRGYLGRKFRALRSIRFIAGFNGFTFFMLDKSFKTYFWRSIMDNTITLLLGLPEL